MLIARLKGAASETDQGFGQLQVTVLFAALQHVIQDVILHMLFSIMLINML